MVAEENYHYELDGQSVTTNDALVSGRAIRALANLNPASDYQLIQLGNVTSQSIGLEEEIDLAGDAPLIFRSFKSDRNFSFTVNERGFEWGADEISAADIRQIASIPEDHELILDSKRDRPIDDDGVVRLKSKGVERILSQPREQICIIVNTIEEYVDPGRITFAELTKLAFPDMQITENTEYTVSYRKGHDEDPEGSLIAGESVKLKKGMIFDVTETDKS